MKALKAKQTTKNGKTQWTLNARSQGAGRFYGETQEEVWQKYRDSIRGVDAVEFTAQDRLAKLELEKALGKGDDWMLLAARSYLVRAAATGVVLKTVFEAAPLWLAWMESKGKSASFVTNCTTVIGHFKTFLKNDGKDHVVNDITNTKIDEFLTLKTGWSVETKNSVRGRLVNFFTYCVGQLKCCAVHPMKNGGVACIRESNARRPRPRIFTLEEVKALFATAKAEMPHMLPYLALGLFCGIRPDKNSEMGRIQKGDIDLKGGRVEVWGKKRERTVKLSHEQKIRVQLPNGEGFKETTVNYSPALAWLKAAPKLEVTMDRYWRRKLCEASGVKWSSDVMRHTFASCHFYFFKNEIDTAEEMGHDRSMKMMRRHYLNRDAEEFAEQFWSLLPEPKIEVLGDAAAVLEAQTEPLRRSA